MPYTPPFQSFRRFLLVAKHSIVNHNKKYYNLILCHDGAYDNPKRSDTHIALYNKAYANEIVKEGQKRYMGQIQIYTYKTRTLSNDKKQI